MKKQILLLLGVVVGVGLNAQRTSTENYVYSKTYNSQPLDSTDMVKPPTETVTYFDGLGRPKQSIIVKGSVNGKDLVTPVKYDGFGRQLLDILPVPVESKNGGYHEAIIDESTANTYYSGMNLGANAYSEKVLENSPLDRLEAQYGPGATWRSNDKKTEIFYETNYNEVKQYIATFDYQTLVAGITLSATKYPAGTLYRTRTVDEDGNNGLEYKNGKGQTLLVRKFVSSNGPNVVPSDTNVYADTYYVYNNYNQLAYVIPPLAVNAGNVSPNTLADLCYQYIYDGNGRLVEKKLPGKGWEYMVYDKQDRLVMTQDANMREKKQWLFTKYDQFSRVAYTGIYTYTEDYTGNNRLGRITEQGRVDAEGSNNEIAGTLTKSGITISYGNNAYPTSITSLLSVNYYDSYPSETPFPTDDKVFGQDILLETWNAKNISVKSMPTASYVKNINDDRWTKNYSFYDEKGRVIGSHSTNFLGGSTIVHTRLDFTGLAMKTKTYNKRLSGEIPVVVEEKFEYTDQKLLKKHYHEVIGMTPQEVLAENTYNDIGQLIEKKVGGTLQTIDYRYNIRGWMTGINLVNDNIDKTKLFSYKIYYEDPINPSLKRYNGNISQIDWWAFDNSTSSRYDYSYDKLNRLVKADFKTIATTGTTDTYFNNEELSYDANGNILTLKRYAKTLASATIGTLIDDLSYTYTGNKAMSIADAVTNNPSGYSGTGQPITYDANGNMLTFPDKKITQAIVYNHLNLPQNITQNNKPTNFIYRADGVKVNKTFEINGETLNTDYLDGFVYTSRYTQQIATALTQDDPATIEAVTAGQQEVFELDEKPLVGPGNPPQQAMASPSFFPTAEGFYDFINLKYIYQYKDHLGNVRVSYSYNSSEEKIDIEDKNDYYPFGLSFVTSSKSSTYSPSTSYKNYKYNGKELQETGMYDYGARMYMPDIGRWGVVDPFAQAYYSISPYQYVLNNPIINIDVKGKWTVSNHYNITATSLSRAGIGKTQADLISNYASVYADHPSSTVLWGSNQIHGTNLSYDSRINYSSTVNSQNTVWEGKGYNYNIWHSMRSDWEKENNTISEANAMQRGLSFGWDNVFSATKSGTKLSGLKANSKEMGQLGQGLHALQDAFAHKGSAMEDHSVANDIGGDMRQAQNVTDSAIMVYSLLTKDYKSFENEKSTVTFDLTGMSAGQKKQVVQALQDYLNYKKDEKK